MAFSTRSGDRHQLVILAVLMAILGFAIAYFPAVSHAGTATSNWGYFTVAGKQYRNQATIITSPGNASARTYVGPTGACAPSGHMGYRARLYNSGGTLVQQSSIGYNSICAAGFSGPTNRNASGAWYSYGVTWGWNGSGYNAFFTFKSPNQNS